MMNIKTYIKKFIPIALVYVLAMGAQTFFVANQAYAWSHCCACGECRWFCTCNGQWPCMWCAAPTPETDQSSTPGKDSSADRDIAGIRVSVVSSATERVIADIRRSNGVKSYAPKLVDHNGSTLKFGCPVDDDDLQGKALGFQVMLQPEK